MSPDGPGHAELLHASCVCVENSAVLIKGASGSGKSSLALTMMAFGAGLVADDRVALSLEKGTIMATAPASISGLIEARGLGLLRASAVQKARVVCVIDMDQIETERLPKRRSISILGQSLTLLYRVEGPQFAPGIVQFLKAGRLDP